MKMSCTTIDGVDLFSGAGGLTLGAELAGIRVTAAVELNGPAAEAYRRNHSDTILLQTDIRNVHAIERRRDRPLILFGGPPCQGFSTSNQRTRSHTNVQNWLFREFFRIADLLHPDWIVFENVKGLLETASGRFSAGIEREFETRNYGYAKWMLNAVDFGVPQTRFRLFFVGKREGRVPEPPRRTVREAVTVRDAIADLPRLTPGAAVDELPYRQTATADYAKKMRGRLTRCTGHLVTSNNQLVLDRYKHIPPGGNWCDIPHGLMGNYTNLVDNRSRHTGIYRRLRWEKPSVVIANYRKNMLVHPAQHRGLSVREAARLQSFPDDYRFAGSIGQQQQQVSNAVPPLLAKAVFCHIVAHY